MTQIKGSQYLFYITNLKILVIFLVKSAILQINYSDNHKWEIRITTQYQ